MVNSKLLLFFYFCLELREYKSNAWLCGNLCRLCPGCWKWRRCVPCVLRLWVLNRWRKSPTALHTCRKAKWINENCIKPSVAVKRSCCLFHMCAEEALTVLNDSLHISRINFIILTQCFIKNKQKKPHLNSKFVGFFLYLLSYLFQN